MEKTNVMRLLEINEIDYTAYEYDAELTEGEQVAAAIGKDPDTVFKTLVTIGSDRQYYVFVIPVNCILSLKKAAKTVKVKSIEMIRQKELLPLTGYLHGGCSPLGMKKKFVTVVHDTAGLFETITCSAGRKGVQVQLTPQDLLQMSKGYYGDLVE
ncbi:MAG: Cys-tRNA(Pro) deacylase [Negativicutes bacterium]|nr:Cys-tRNA(Pro) deacylase [Negativicutes bacterium]